MQRRIELLKAESSVLGEVVAIFAASLRDPHYYRSAGSHRGFRYLSPTPKHFCLIKAVRAVSGINAAIALLEKCFVQEICVLMRTIVECTSQVDYILAGLDKGILQSPQKEVVEAYFSDFKRDQVSDFKRLRLRQGDVHKAVGSHLDNTIKSVEGGDQFADVDTSMLMSNVYLTFCNYVHARYPEVMDMYGGTPGRFHVDGMLGTPKDLECVEILTTFMVTVSNTLRGMIYKFDMVATLRGSPRLANWLSASDEAAAG